MLKGFLVFWFFGLETRMDKEIEKNHNFSAFWFLVFWFSSQNRHKKNGRLVV
jgi:hypothetical protein